MVTVSLVLTVTACSSTSRNPERGPPSPGGLSPSSAPTSSTPPSDQGRRVTRADDGATVRLTVGGNADLVVRDPLAADPTVSGDSVTLVEVDSAAATGQRQWEVRAVGLGTSDVTATERSRTFTVRFEVARG